MRYLIVMAGWLMLWGALSLLFDLKASLLPDLPSTLQAAGTLVLDHEFLRNLGITLLRVAPGAVISGFVGVPVGIWLACFPAARHFFEPPLDFLRGVPAAALFPVVIILFGIGEPARVVLTCYVSFPILVTTALVGAMERPENAERRRYLRIHRRDLAIWHLPLCLLWDAMPSVLGGMKIAISLSLVIIIVSEMFFVGGTGIGWYAWDQYQAFKLPNMYGSLFLLGVLSLILNAVFDVLSNRFSHRI